MGLKIAVIVPGRFHAFDLARGLLERGHDVWLFTNYPKWAVERFGFPGNRVVSLWPHGVASRVSGYLFQRGVCRYPEEWLCRWFGNWVAKQLATKQWDITHSWSGFSEEVLQMSSLKDTCQIVMRGSAHIRVQSNILEEEEKRVQTKLDRPSRWIIEREEREYAISKNMIVLSRFAYESFIEEGVPSEKLLLLPLGARTEKFRPSPDVIEARCRRILSREPLRVLYVGALSFRKGMWDMAEILRKADRSRFHFRFVGPSTAEVKKLLKELRSLAEFYQKQPQQELPRWYAWGDIFIFPTIEDGFAVVLAQANASALPVLATTNCSGPDLILDGQTGWVLPIRNPTAFLDRLCWCDTHREELAAMVRRIYQRDRSRDWSDVAADFEKICSKKASGESDPKIYG